MGLRLPRGMVGVVTSMGTTLMTVGRTIVSAARARVGKGVFVGIGVLLGAVVRVGSIFSVAEGVAVGDGVGEDNGVGVGGGGARNTLSDKSATIPNIANATSKMKTRIQLAADNKQPFSF